MDPEKRVASDPMDSLTALMKSGVQPIKVSIKEKDASIAAPDKVYVKASL